jgi:predicted membrane protein
VVTDGQMERKKMLETIIIILVVLWLIGLVTSNTFGGVLHVLLVVALVVLVFRLLSGRKVL